ncbi:MAG: hypothetical protein GTO54_12950 [Nitrososphaeria archaeon]|nr:hypothetical protein [Nitrososphaeria archaeon]
MADGGATKLAQNLSHGAGGSWDANLGTGDAPDPGSAFHVCAQKHQDAAGGVESYGWMDTSAASAWKDDDGGYSYNNWAYDYDYNFDNLRAVGDNGTDCDVRHIIVYNRPLTDAEIELVRLWILEQEA